METTEICIQASIEDVCLHNAAHCCLCVEQAKGLHLDIAYQPPLTPVLLRVKLG